MSRPLLFLNLAHAYDHFFLLIFPTAVLALAPAWDRSYGEALAFGTSVNAAAQWHGPLARFGLRQYR